MTTPIRALEALIEARKTAVPVVGSPEELERYKEFNCLSLTFASDHAPALLARARELEEALRTIYNINEGQSARIAKTALGEDGETT